MVSGGSVRAECQFYKRSCVLVRGNVLVKSDSSIGSNYHYEGGLYIASNVSDSSRVWNCKVTNPEEIVGHRGDLEHMASYLGNGEVLKDGKEFNGSSF